MNNTAVVRKVVTELYRPYKFTCSFLFWLHVLFFYFGWLLRLPAWMDFSNGPTCRHRRITTRATSSPARSSPTAERRARLARPHLPGHTTARSGWCWRRLMRQPLVAAMSRYDCFLAIGSFMLWVRVCPFFSGFVRVMIVLDAPARLLAPWRVHTW